MEEDGNSWRDAIAKEYFLPKFHRLEKPNPKAIKLQRHTLVT